MLGKAVFRSFLSLKEKDGLSCLPTRDLTYKVRLRKLFRQTCYRAFTGLVLTVLLRLTLNSWSPPAAASE